MLPEKWLDRVLRLLLDKDNLVSASLNNKLSGWDCCIYQRSNTSEVEECARPHMPNQTAYWYGWSVHWLKLAHGGEM